MDQYEEQAKKFLKDTGTTFEIEYLYTGPYSGKDDDERDVYRFTLMNSKGTYSSRFGDSVANTKERLELRHKAKPAKFPSAYDILSGITGLCLETFEEFYSELGYDNLPLSEYPRVMGIFSACQDEAKAMRLLFTEEEQEALSEVE